MLSPVLRNFALRFGVIADKYHWELTAGRFIRTLINNRPRTPLQALSAELFGDGYHWERQHEIIPAEADRYQIYAAEDKWEGYDRELRARLLSYCGLKEKE